MNWDLVFGLIVALLGVLGEYLRRKVQADEVPKNLQTVLSLARTAVQAAEEFGRREGITGEDKYDFASAALVEAAKRVGVRLKPAEVQVFIHAAVGELRDLLEIEAAEQAAYQQQTAPIAA